MALTYFYFFIFKIKSPSIPLYKGGGFKIPPLNSGESFKIPPSERWVGGI
jgi:hypothetical protein